MFALKDIFFILFCFGHYNADFKHYLYLEFAMYRF